MVLLENGTMNRSATARPLVALATADYRPQVDVLGHHFASGHVLYLLHALAKEYFTAEGIYVNVSRTNHSPKVIRGLEEDIFKIGLATATTLIRSVAAWVAKGNDP